jgi:hypothetical protein
MALARRRLLAPLPSGCAERVPSLVRPEGSEISLLCSGFAQIREVRVTVPAPKKQWLLREFGAAHRPGWQISSRLISHKRDGNCGHGGCCALQTLRTRRAPISAGSAAPGVEKSYFGTGGGKFLRSLAIAFCRFFCCFSGLARGSIVLLAAPRHTSFFSPGTYMSRAS